MKELGPIRTGLLCCLGSLGAGILLTELLGLPEYHTALFVRRDCMAAVLEPGRWRNSGNG